MRLKTKFQDEDFDFGEVVDASIMYGYDDKIEVCCDEKMKHRKYNSIKDLTDHWEDAPEESKGSALDLMILTLTNFIENEPSDNVDLEDCKQMLEKLKAWERLKENGFSFESWDGYVDTGDEFDSGDHFECCGFVNARGKFLKSFDKYTQFKADLDLLFGGEE